MGVGEEMWRENLEQWQNDDLPACFQQISEITLRINKIYFIIFCNAKTYFQKMNEWDFKIYLCTTRARAYTHIYMECNWWEWYMVVCPAKIVHATNCSNNNSYKMLRKKLQCSIFVRNPFDELNFIQILYALKWHNLKMCRQTK